MSALHPIRIPTALADLTFASIPVIPMLQMHLPGASHQSVEQQVFLTCCPPQPTIVPCCPQPLPCGSSSVCMRGVFMHSHVGVVSACNPMRICKRASLCAHPDFLGRAYQGVD